MDTLISLFVIILISLGSFSQASQFERVDNQIKSYDAKVLELRLEFAKTNADEGNKEWVKSKLAFMVEVDQTMRSNLQSPYKNSYTSEETDYFFRQYLPRLNQLDSENTSDLKKLLKKYHWFTVSEFGGQADSHAWLLVQHADLDPQFQKEVLVIITDLWPKNETSARNYAYLFDRVAASWHDPSKRTLQRYGTQGQCIGPRDWEPISMEEPEFLDQRRASVGLPAMAEYKLVVKELCP